MHWHCKLTWANGDIYEGEYHDGKKHGRGHQCRALCCPGGHHGVLEEKEDETQEADDDDNVPVTLEDADDEQVDDLA